MQWRRLKFMQFACIPGVKSQLPPVSCRKRVSVVKSFLSCCRLLRRLEEVALWNSNEYGSGDRGNGDGSQDCLDEDGVLDGTKSRLLNPHLTIENFADDIPMIVFGNPWLIFVAVVGTKTVEGSFLEIKVG